MDLYIGAKLITAKPKIKNGLEGYEVIYSDGYISWSPKLQFEEAYRKVTNAEKLMLG